jgi:alkylation response protein AidB-like acyl-CoA dehydrogenase
MICLAAACVLELCVCVLTLAALRVVPPPSLACSVGGAEFCLDYAWQYAAERRQFGQPVGAFQATQVRVGVGLVLATGLRARCKKGAAPSAKASACVCVCVCL